MMNRSACTSFSVAFIFPSQIKDQIQFRGWAVVQGGCLVVVFFLTSHVNLGRNSNEKLNLSNE